jgi:alpha-ketoglutarate-dependent taurine dioxygenase
VLFRGFDVGSAAAFAEIVSCFSNDILEYRERSSPRIEVKDRIYTSTEYPADQAIFAHNENSYAHIWPRRIFFCCLTPPVEGGATPIVDVRSVYHCINPEIRRAFNEVGVLYVRNFSPQIGISWKTAFQTERRDEVEQLARDAGYDLQWRDEDRLTSRRLGPASGRHPLTGEPIWFNHAAFFHVSTFPDAIRRALTARLREDELPNNTYYGDGSQIKDEVVEHVRSCYLANQLIFDWRRNDVLMLDNMLVAHARQAYRGARQILVAMTDAFRSEWLVSCEGETK